MTSLERLIIGLKIAQKYEPASQVSVEHDIIYAGPSINDMSGEDITRMREAGWHEVEEFECWEFFT